MTLGTAISTHHIPIRLTEERWHHITLAHPEIESIGIRILLQTLTKPDCILRGDSDDLLAVRKLIRKNTWLVIVYKEISTTDGFIITAYMTTAVKWLLKREIIWNNK